MIFVEGFIFDHGNTPHIPTIAHCQEKIHIRMFMKGMLSAVEVHISIDIKRRHPLWTIPVQLIRQLHKALYLCPVICIHFFDGEHEALPERDDILASTATT